MLNHAFNLRVLRFGGTDNQTVGAGVDGDQWRSSAGWIVGKHLRDRLRNFCGFCITQCDHSHFWRATLRNRFCVELCDHLIRGFEDRGRAADDHCIQSSVSCNTHWCPINTAAQVFLAKTLRHVTQAHHGAVGEQFLHQWCKRFGACVLEHDRLYLRSIRCPILIKRVDQFLNGVKIWSDSGENQRVGASGRHNGNLHRILCCGTWHGSRGLLQRRRQLICIRKCQRVNADLLRIGASDCRSRVKLCNQLIGHCNQ